MPTRRRAGSASVLLVGKGEPDRGGIRTFLDTLLDSDLARSRTLAFLNLAHAGIPEGGRASLGNLRRTMHDAVRVRRAAHGVAIVHLHSAMAPAVTAVRGGVLALAARSRGSRVIVHVHGGLVQVWLTSRVRRALLRSALTPAHQVVAVSSGGERALRAVVPPARLRLLDNGIDAAAFVPLEQVHEPPRILFVGLLTPRKGVLDLLTAARLLRERDIPHELLLLGGTPDEGPAAEAEVRAALTPEVRLLGSWPYERMPAAYHEADVFCLPSWWEASPLSVLEAMASALPVVATDVGDVARIVRHDETGLIVPARSPAALADALEQLLCQPERRRAMGAAGRARVLEHFSRQRLEHELNALYDQLEGRTT